MEIGFAKMNENKCSFRGKCRKIRKTSPKHNLPKLIMIYTGVIAGTNEIAQLDLDRLDRDYDAKKLFSVLQNGKSYANYSQQEQKIIDLFTHMMESRIKKERKPDSDSN